MFEPLLAASRAALAAEESCWVAPEMLFAWTAAQRLAEPWSPATRRGQLTCLVGSAGSGKSLFASQAVRSFARQHPRLRSGYLPAATWGDALLAADQSGKLIEFYDWCGKLAIVVCEDLELALAQTELTELWSPWLDELLHRDVRVLVTLSAPPGSLSACPPRLSSRLHAGLLATLPPLSEASRCEFVRQRAAGCHLSLTDDVVKWLTAQPPGTPRSIVQFVDQLARGPAMSRWDLAAVQRRLQPNDTDRRPLLSAIAAAVAAEFHVTLTDLRSPSRNLALRVPRQCAMYLAHHVAGWPLQQIGRYFGGRTHTSVSHSCKRLQDVLPTAPSLQEQVRRLRERILEQRSA